MYYVEILYLYNVLGKILNAKSKTPIIMNNTKNKSKYFGNYILRIEKGRVLFTEQQQQQQQNRL